MRRRSAWTHFADAWSAALSGLSARPMHAIPEGPAGTQSTTQTGSVTDGAHEGDRTMKKTIFAVLAALGISLATGALAPAANAYTYLFPPAQNGGGNS